MSEIIPTILTSDLAEFIRKIKLIRDVCPKVQIDIIDGIFAEEKTADLGVLGGLGILGELGVDLHLMVNKPESWVNRAIEVLPDRIIGQIEMMSKPEDFIKMVVEGGVEVGIALDLETPLSIVPEEIYHAVDLVLILAVKAGFGGQKFDKRALEKIEEIRGIVGELGKVGVDGGLDKESIKLCQKAGANIFYIGKSFWEAEDLGKKYNELLRLVI